MNGKWFLFLAFLTLVALAFWIAFTTFSKVSLPIAGSGTQEVQSINPKFDTDLIDQLEVWSKGYWDEQQ